ncbi:MAG: hypothetical protein WD060_04340 [Pirellulales bacterium]
MRWQVWQRREVWRLAARRSLVVVVVIACAWAASGGGARAERGSGKAPRRATPPSTPWDKGTLGNFFDDAFATLKGQRPSFSATRGVAANAAAAQPAAAGSAGGVGFKWSTLISEETLTDEVKDMKAAVAGTAARPADFKGGGYDTAREAFSAIALAFGVIAAYDQDIRWKKDAVNARDLFARVGFNCKVGTDQSLAETKLRLADLEAMLDGGSPQGKADRDEDFSWHQVAGRPALMKRVGAAETGIGAAIASKGDFERELERLVHDAEIVAVIGEAIQQPDFEYHDDDSYRGYAATMRDAAVKIRDACRKKDYETARAAASELKKSCDACHGDYRS